MIFKIIDIILIVLLIIVGIETIIKFKKSEGMKIDDVRGGLLIRIDIIMVLTVLLALSTIMTIIFNK